MSTSNLEDLDLNSSAAFLIESNDVKSRGRKVMAASGDVDLISSIAASALEDVLAAKKICSGL